MSLPLPLNSDSRAAEIAKLRQKQIAELQARRAARGMADPLNRLSAHISAAIANGAAPIENKES